MKLEDIAQKAGVSRSTVSRVINDDPNVSERTRMHVNAIIEAENFYPNAAARALVTRRSDVIGVAIPSIENIFSNDNNYWSLILAGLGQATRESNYALLLWTGDLTRKEDGLLRNASNRHMVDGLVVASLPSDHPLRIQLMKLRSPMVLIDKPLVEPERFSYVGIDNVRVGEVATEHLIKLGRKRIAHITGHSNISDAVDRATGYKNALHRAGLPIDENLIYPGAFYRRAGYEGLKHLLQYQPDAVFAAGDTIAIGVLDAAKEAGLRVPADLSLIGVDDLDVARTSVPLLTTIRQPVMGKGEAAARMLIDMIERRLHEPRHIMLPFDLVIRDSCGASPHAL